MGLNYKQGIAILIAILSVLAISTTNLADLFGPTTAKVISSTANMLNAMLAGILGVLTGQASTVKEVAAMPGVERIRINAQADQTLAAIAMDPAMNKVSPLPADATKVAATALGIDKK